MLPLGFMLQGGANDKVTKFADGTELLRIVKIYTNSEKTQTCVLLLNVWITKQQIKYFHGKKITLSISR